MSGRYITVPRKIIATPRDGDTLLARWWCHIAGEGLIFWQGQGMRGWTPQCNENRKLPERLAENYPGAEVVYIPAAYLGGWNDDCGHTLGWYREEIAAQLNPEAVTSCTVPVARWTVDESPAMTDGRLICAGNSYLPIKQAHAAADALNTLDRDGVVWGPGRPMSELPDGNHPRVLLRADGGPYVAANTYRSTDAEHKRLCWWPLPEAGPS